MIREYVTERQKEGAGASIRNQLIFLSSLYEAAKGWSDGPDTNPVKNYEKGAIPKARRRTRFFTEAEYQRILAKCRWDYQRLFVTLGCYTGMRSSELLALTWDMVDLKAGVITLPPSVTKTNSTRMIPIFAPLKNTLLSTPETVRSGQVVTRYFGCKPIKTVRAGYNAVLKAAEVSDATIHTMRHTFTSWCRSKKIDPAIVQSMLGHASASMTGRYTHVTEADVLAATSAFAEAQSPTQLHHFLSFASAIKATFGQELQEVKA